LGGGAQRPGGEAEPPWPPPGYATKTNVHVATHIIHYNAYKDETEYMRLQQQQKMAIVSQLEFL
jgi:hypothetical protein